METLNKEIKLSNFEIHMSDHQIISWETNKVNVSVSYFGWGLYEHYRNHSIQHVTYKTTVLCLFIIIKNYKLSMQASVPINYFGATRTYTHHFQSIYIQIILTWDKHNQGQKKFKKLQMHLQGFWHDFNSGN